LNRAQQDLYIPKEVWSQEFALACAELGYHDSNDGQKALNHVWLMKEKDTAVFRDVGSKMPEVTITRRASPYLKNLLRMKKEDESCPEEISGDSAGIKFEVRANSGRNYYLMYHNWAGALIVKLESIQKPDDKGLNEDENWAKTMTFRRVFDTPDAVRKSKGQKDSGIYMGETSMREVWKKEKEGEKETVHEGDTEYDGDIRTLVGIVRWKKKNMNDLPTDYFTETRTDLVITGDSVRQNPKI
jgi:hypothetical protein